MQNFEFYYGLLLAECERIQKEKEAKGEETTLWISELEGPLAAKLINEKAGKMLLAKMVARLFLNNVNLWHEMGDKADEIIRQMFDDKQHAMDTPVQTEATNTNNKVEVDTEMN